MPKRPANDIIEHRIGLTGSMDKVVNNVNEIAKTANYIKTGGLVVAGVGVAGLGYLAYNLAKYFGGNNPITDAKNFVFDTFDKFLVPPTDSVDDIFDNRQNKLNETYEKDIAYYQGIIESDYATDAQKEVARENMKLANQKYKEKTNENNTQRARVKDKVESVPVGGPLGGWYRGFKYVFD